MLKYIRLFAVSGLLLIPFSVTSRSADADKSPITFERITEGAHGNGTQ